ncbi:metabotropic glutamate receptor 4-like [Sycon ciliatum]|uniref:metabotropic glutamate receptor 4-like n=1 Tax=Sycon ciliatum TaxID=27933 RepID=UPI0031F62D2E
MMLQRTLCILASWLLTVASATGTRITTGSDRNVFRGPCPPSTLSPGQTCTREDVGADLYLGGLFPVHRYDSAAQSCTDATLTAEFLQMPEGMRHAVMLVNNSTRLLPNITLGYEMRDTCISPSHALLECLEFLGRSTDNENCTEAESVSGERTRPNVVGVVGAAISTLSIKTTELLGPFKIPMVSYASTSPRLSNKREFPYFLRTIPSDAFTAQATASMIRDMDWRFIGFIHTDDHYGQDGVNMIKTALGLSSAECTSSSSAESLTARCQSRTWVIQRHLLENDTIYLKIWNDLLYSRPENQTTVIVLFSQKTEAINFLGYLKHCHPDSKLYDDALHKNITFIGSDGWGDSAEVVRGNTELVQGAVSALPRAPSYEPFRRHWAGLTPYSHPENPWLRDLWRSVFHCSQESPDALATGQPVPACLKEQKLADEPMMGKIPYIYNAVFAFAAALDNIYRGVCRFNVTCLKRRAYTDLFRELRSVKFTTIFDSQFEFDASGDPGLPHYDINNIQVAAKGQSAPQTPAATPSSKASKASPFQIVGKYEAELLNISVETCKFTANGSVLFALPGGDAAACFAESIYLNESLVVWNSGHHDRPISLCSTTCPQAGYKRAFSGRLSCQSCCWQCTACPSNYFSTSPSSATCSPCPSNQSSSEAASGCTDVPQHEYSGGSGLPIVLTCIGVLGMASAIAAILYSARKAASSFFVLGREPTFAALAGLLLAYMSVLVQSSGPRGGACFMRAFLSAIGLTALISSLLVFALYRITSLHGLTLGMLLRSTRNRLLATAAAECVTCAIVIIACAGGQCSSALQTVHTHVSTERRCGFRSVDTACLLYVCVLNIALITLCVLVIYRVKRKGGAFSDCYEMTSRLHPLTAVAALVTTILTIVFLVSQHAGQNWSAQVEDAILHVTTLQIATSYFLIVLFQPIRKLGTIMETQDRNADSNKPGMGKFRLVVHGPSEFSSAGFDRAAANTNAFPNICGDTGRYQMSVGMVTYFGSELGKDDDVIKDQYSDVESVCDVIALGGLEAKADPGLVRLEPETEKQQDGLPAGPPENNDMDSEAHATKCQLIPPAVDLILSHEDETEDSTPTENLGKTVFCVVKRIGSVDSARSIRSTRPPSVVAAGAGPGQLQLPPCQEHGAGCAGDEDDCWVQVVAQTKM